MSWIYKSFLLFDWSVWSSLVWSGKSFSYGFDHSDVRVRGNFGLVTNEQPGETREREKAVFCQKKRGKYSGHKNMKCYRFPIASSLPSWLFLQFLWPSLLYFRNMDNQKEILAILNLSLLYFVKIVRFSDHKLRNPQTAGSLPRWPVPNGSKWSEEFLTGQSHAPQAAPGNSISDP